MTVIFFYKTVAFKKLFDTYFFYKTVCGVRGVGGGGRWTGRVLSGEGGRIWRGGIAIEMEGDRDRVSMKFKNIH